MSSTTTRRCTIDTIPAELLLTIFRTHVEPRQGAGHYRTVDADVRHRRSITLSHVCSRWRTLALGDAALWTDIRVAGTAKLESRYFHRSRPLPINLTIDLEAMGRRGRVDCAARVGRGLLSQSKQDLARIRSIRTTHFRDYDAHSMISVIEKLKVPALTELFIRTTSPDGSPGAGLKPLRLLQDTLTTLELHNASQILDGKAVKHALEMCPGLASLVLGGLLLDSTL